MRANERAFPSATALLDFSICIVPLTLRYTKRALLAAVYKATEFYMMQDKSTDHQATWDFLDRRLSGAVELGTTFRQQRQSVENVVGSLFGAASTVANLMGAQKK